ncbi:MAG: class I SAM-dependent methyltransferase, partial [Anaerolineales bacterium]
HHLRRSEDIPFWKALAETWGDPILELGCGTGRVLLNLVRLGCTTTGLDNNPKMLAFLRASYKLETYPNLVIIQDDMADFQLETHFSLIILPCNTYSTFQSRTRQAILCAVRSHLSPGGIFAFSIPNPAILAELPVTGEPDLEDNFPHPQTGFPIQVFSSWERGPESVSFHWRYDLLHPTGNVTSVTASASHVLDPANVYLDELQAAGLIPVTAYGQYDRAPYTPDSTYLIVLATL